MHKIIQKEYTFDTEFGATIFNYRKMIKVLKAGDYDLVGIEKKWSLRRPFHIKIIAIIKIVDEVDVEKIRYNKSQAFLDDRTKKDY